METYNRQHNQKTIIGSVLAFTSLQTHQLQKQIAQLIHKNKRTYMQILQIKQQFSYQLYKISEFQAISKSLGKGLLMRQLDRLREQQNYLNSELQTIHSIAEDKANDKGTVQSTETHHFQLLKNIWTKDGCKKYGGTLEHINDLNLMVGQIKNSIHSLIKFQANDALQFQENYLKTFKILHERNRQCQKCHEYKAKLYYLNGKLEGLEEQMSKLSDENIQYLEQINHKDDKLKKANKLLKQQSQLRIKTSELEEELIKKDQLIKRLKKERQAQKESKFINVKDNYELIVKSTSFDMNKYQQEIEMSLQCLISLIATEKTDDQFNSYDHKDPTSSTSTTESPNSYRKYKEVLQKNAFGFENNFDHCKSDKIKPTISPLQQQLQSQQARRYSRNGSKRSHRGASIHDEASNIISTRHEEI